MKREPTEAQRAQSQANRERIRRLAQEIKAMTPEQQASMLDGEIKEVDGHVLSAKNQMLLVHQGCKATIVAGFWDWKKAGRKVMAGQHGYALWVPFGAPKKDSDDKGDSTEIRFALRYVFGIDQTETIEGSKQAESKPQETTRTYTINRKSTLEDSRMAAMSAITGVRV